MRGYEQYSWADIRHLLELRIPMRGYEFNNYLPPSKKLIVTNPHAGL